jgi:hypothetical protein
MHIRPYAFKHVEITTRFQSDALALYRGIICLDRRPLRAMPLLVCQAARFLELRELLKLVLKVTAEVMRQWLLQYIRPLLAVQRLP